jgi:crotonobetainyl-CoA:carnitine CoA-transferase CaiB-like acyl-CoA transferase
VLELPGGAEAVAGRLLAMLGADVAVSAEGAVRHYGPPWAAAGKRAADARDAARLVAAADVVIGEPPGPVHPRLVTCFVSPFGGSGPRAGWRASEQVVQALGGMAAASGAGGGPPLPAPAMQAHQQAGIFAAIGILAALLARERSGHGQHVEVSMQAAVAASLAHVHAPYLHDGTVTRRAGRLHWSRCFRVGPTRDGWAAYTTIGDWTTLVEWMRADGMARDLVDASYAEPAVRRQRAEHVFDVIEAWGRTRPGEQLAHDAQLRRLAIAAVRTPAAMLADPQLAARGFFASGGLPGPPFRLGPLPARLSRLPSLDEDAAAVLDQWDREPRFGETAGGKANGDRPLRGLRVADFTWLVAGPTATAVLADLGADVVKIEHPATTDAGDRRGGFTGALNRGKRSIVLDLTTVDGRRTAERLALSADVVVDNFSARVMEHWRLDPGTLRSAKPGLICMRMTGFGTTGPDREQVSFGPTLEARAGFTALMADAAGAPIGFGFSYADVASGHLAALALLAACLRRRRTGEGATIDMAQLEAVAWLLTPALVPPADRPAAPDGIFPCAGDDRWIALTVFTDDDWRRFAEVAGSAPWMREARFAALDDRVRHRRALDMQLAAWTRAQDADALVARLQRAGVAAGLVAGAAELCDGDPQLAAWGFFATVATPEGGSVRLAGPPFRLSAAPVGVSGPGPLLGEHTDAVLSELMESPPPFTGGTSP